MNLNPFAKKVDLSNPYDLYPLVYRIAVTPKLFHSDKEFIKELSNLVGAKFENRVTDIPLILSETPKTNNPKELVEILKQSTTEWRHMPTFGMWAVGEKFKKLRESPKEFKTFSLDINVGFDVNEMWYPLYCRTINGYLTACRMQSESKAPVKGLPLSCSQCKNVFVEDANSVDETELNDSGCCENCGSLQAKYSDDVLSKAYVYVRESEKKLGVTIFRTDY